MGSGKSTLGPGLAKLMNYSFLDLDKEIERLAGKTIPEIFELEGEDRFRKLEKQTLYHTGQSGKVVVATGGGTPCFYQNMEWMNDHGISVYLKWTPEELLKNITSSADERPLMSGQDEADKLNFIRTTLADREKFYLQSQIIIASPTLQDAPGQILSALEKLRQ